METAPINLDINRGEDWTVQLIFTDDQDNPMNLAKPFRMDIKDQAGVIVCALTSTDDPPDFQTTIPEIEISSAVGLVQLHLTSAVTDALPNGSFVYDLFGHVDDGDVYAGDQVVRFCKGRVTIDKRITETF